MVIHTATEMLVVQYWMTVDAALISAAMRIAYVYLVEPQNLSFSFRGTLLTSSSSH